MSGDDCNESSVHSTVNKTRVKYQSSVLHVSSQKNELVGVRVKVIDSSLYISSDLKAFKDIGTEALLT